MSFKSEFEEDDEAFYEVATLVVKAVLFVILVVVIASVLSCTNPGDL